VSRLLGKVAAVTGGARGIGRAIAEAYAREGAAVVVADIDGDAATETAARIAVTGARALAVRVDVTKPAEASGLVDQAVRAFGALDVLVNNAGVIGRVDWLDMTESEWDRVMDVNVKGTFLCGQAAARHMTARGTGNIVNICSNSAESTYPTTLHYCASKGAVKTLTKAMALALAPKGVRCNAIGPGPTETALSNGRLDVASERASTLAHIPLGRVGAPSDLAGAAIFLASDEAAWVTGITLFVDGGWLTF
jgi:NAD(P)-dependent dehydrogenase (short-subunit alcohol dehydrogenase family)